MGEAQTDERQKIQALELSIASQTAELRQLQKSLPGIDVPNYSFDTLAGEVSLLELFGSHEQLLVIHNMGHKCRYCTLWGDGINGFVSHIESTMALVMVSKDSPEEQRQFARSRQWQFRMASHRGAEYQQEQVAVEGMSNMPGIVCYRRDGKQIRRHASGVFGPGDLFCSLWHIMGLSGIDLDEWTPQYNYWLRPDQLEDGGENVLG